MESRPFRECDWSHLEPETADDLGGLFVDSRGARGAGIEDDKCGYPDRPDKLAGRLQRGEIEGPWSARNEDQVGEDRGLSRHGVSMWRRVNQSELGAQFRRSLQLASQKRRRP